jgi:hypothetical protein
MEGRYEEVSAEIAAVKKHTIIVTKPKNAVFASSTSMEGITGASN